MGKRRWGWVNRFDFGNSGEGPGGGGQRSTPIFTILFLWTIGSYSILSKGQVSTFPPLPKDIT